MDNGRDIGYSFPKKLGENPFSLRIVSLKLWEMLITPLNVHPTPLKIQKFPSSIWKCNS